METMKMEEEKESKRVVLNPYPVLGVYMTPIDFFLINKNGSLRLSGIKFCDFFYII